MNTSKLIFELIDLKVRNKAFKIDDVDVHSIP